MGRKILSSGVLLADLQGVPLGICGIPSRVSPAIILVKDGNAFHLSVLSFHFKLGIFTILHHSAT